MNNIPFETLVKSASNALFACIKVQPKEKALLIYDKTTREIADAFIKAASDKNIVLTVSKIELTGSNGKDPDPATVALINKHDIVIAPTFFSLTHCPAMSAARKRGLRGATLPGITPEIFAKGLDTSPEDLRNAGKAWMAKLSGNHKIKLISDKGTNLEFSIGKYPLKSDDGCLWGKGDVGNLPAGEVFIAPDPCSGNGVLAVDGSIATQEWENNAETALIKIENGKAVSFQGKRADELRKTLEKCGEKAFLLAEFGIGTNEFLSVGGNLLEDEKVKGTVHMAFGNNRGFGGNNDVPVHIDCVILNPDVEDNGATLMKKGKWTL